VHFDVVEVSGTNQYKVSPAEFVSTAVPPMVVVDNAPPPAAAAAALEGAGLLLAELALDGADPLPAATELPELPHAVTASAIAASPAAPHIFRICGLLTARK
jgi:hypothetical protein